MYSLGLIFILQCFFKELYGLSDDFIEKEKEALRYGFHQTYDCQNFEKAFKCIRKCLDEKFDVAYADKTCTCTCYYKKEKEKYRYLALKGKGQTPPKTKLPAWAQPVEPVQEEESEEEDKPEIVAVGTESTTTPAITLAGNDTDGTDVGNATLDANADGDAPAEEGVEGEGGADGEGEGEEGGGDEAAGPEEE